MPTHSLRVPAVRRLLLTVTLLALVGTVMSWQGALQAESAPFPQATPHARCGKGSLPEGKVQGRVPAADYASGRAAKGYRCNTRLLGHQGSTGGFKVGRYTDRRGHLCAYYDSTTMFPTDIKEQSSDGLGVIVLDMDRPAHPRRVRTLTSPTMLSPHESLLINQRRGLLAAVMGNAFAAPGVLEIYDLKADCRQPRLLSRTPAAGLGHESGWSLDGRTFYASSSGGQTFTVLDVADPSLPLPLFVQRGVNYHGMRLSADGRTLYVANIGDDLSGGTLPGDGLRILDVSQIQERRADPQVSVLSNLTWPEGSIPQVAQPFDSRGHHYLLQVDEFSKYGVNGGSLDADKAVVGAARIIDVDDPHHPKVVSRLRLDVQQPKARTAAKGDPGASSPLGGYTAHYCSVPYADNPKLAACSMIGSGLRVFDIRNVRHPKEVAYFNQPTADGSSAFSSPAWDARTGSVWYADGNSGFYAVQLTNGVGRLVAHR